ncbi:MAG: peptidylprolyl isomerase [Steroidobacteraceae bacterium]|nr:peptidylprolyl isomerase [Steroidobacteraceae bacterium]
MTASTPSCALITLAAVLSAAAAAAPPRSMGELLVQSTPGDWRKPDPENTLYLQLDTGRVVIELAPGFAPRHVAAIRALARSHYYDGQKIGRVQDNFVVQWGEPATKGITVPALAGEFSRPITPALPFTVLPDTDGYAPAVGFTDGFPAARDVAGKTTWLAHCYGTLGVGRDIEANSGSGAELYVVIGHAPRQLDRNGTVAGRVVYGMESLAALPRGTGPLGFYEKPAEGVTIHSVRVTADVPVTERIPIEVLRTDTPLFAQLVELRRNRADDWYKVPAGYIDLCNVPLPARVSSSTPPE